MNVLIVADAIEARERLLRLVGQLDGCRVLDPVAGGEGALAALDSQPVDVLLLGLADLPLAARLTEREQTPALLLYLPEAGALAAETLAEADIAHVCLDDDAATLAVALERAQRPTRNQLLTLTRPPRPGQPPRSHIGARFVRIHRNALVARARIERLQRTPLGHFQLHLAGLGEETLTVSRRHVSGLRKLMQTL